MIKLKNQDFSIFQSSRIYKLSLSSARKAVKKLNSKTGIYLSLEKNNPIIFFHKSTKSGYVWPNLYKNRIFLNSDFFKNNEREFLNVIIPHEVAHLFQTSIDPSDKPHGNVWVKMMKLLSLPPNIYHNFPISESVPVYRYICSCKKHEVGLRLHNNIQKTAEQQPYLCPLCKKQIVFLSKIS